MGFGGFAVPVVPLEVSAWLCWTRLGLEYLWELLVRESEWVLRRRTQKLDQVFKKRTWVAELDDQGKCTDVDYVEFAGQVLWDVTEDVQGAEGHVLWEILLDRELQVGYIKAFELPGRIYLARQVDQPAPCRM